MAFSTRDFLLALARESLFILSFLVLLYNIYNAHSYTHKEFMIIIVVYNNCIVIDIILHSPYMYIF